MNTTVHLFELVKVETGNKRERYCYQVRENGHVIAERKSNREYVACYVMLCKGADGSVWYETPFFFSKLHLIGRNKSAQNDPYAVAVLDLHRKALEASMSFVKYISTSASHPGEVAIIGVDPGGIDL